MSLVGSACSTLDTSLRVFKDIKRRMKLYKANSLRSRAFRRALGETVSQHCDVTFEVLIMLLIELQKARSHRRRTTSRWHNTCAGDS